MNNNVISFDFDGTLSDHHNGEENIYKETIQENAKLVLSLGFDVHIITRRFDESYAQHGLVNEHIPVFKMAEKLGIKKENLHFTNRAWKYEKIKRVGSFIHIDDDNAEMTWLENYVPSVKRVYVGSVAWQNMFLASVEEELKYRKNINSSLWEKIKKIIKKV